MTEECAVVSDGVSPDTPGVSNDQSQTMNSVQPLDTGPHPPSGTKPAKATPAKSSSSPKTKQANQSTPRLRSRPVPARSKSSPLARSLSVRVSKKDRRWSMRIADPDTPVSTTYRDDYQNPELSLKLHGLNLETSLSRCPDTGLDHLDSSTTYRESYKWRAEPSPRSTDPPPENSRVLMETPRRAAETSKGSKGSNAGGGRSRADETLPSPYAQEYAGNSKDKERHRRLAPRPPNLELPVHPPEHRDSNRQSPSKAGDTLVTANGKEKRGFASPSGSPSSTIDSLSVSPASERGVSLRPADERGVSQTPARERGVSTKRRGERSVPHGDVSDFKPGQTTNGVWSPDSTVSSTPKLVNGSERPKTTWSSGTAKKSPLRSPAYQLQSSNGGCPFAYGSDSGAWV